MLPELAVVHLVATVFMAGVIVFVQVVHYPLMGHVGVAEFTRYEGHHTVRTGWVVIPAMTVELATGVWLVAAAASGFEERLAWTGLGLLAVIWASTALLQAPAHGRLIRGFEPSTHRRLVRTNWIRTVAWALRVPVAVLLAG